MKVFLILALAVALASAKRAKKADIDDRSEFNAMWDSVLSDIQEDVVVSTEVGPDGQPIVSEMVRRGPGKLGHLKDKFNDDTKTTRFNQFKKAKSKINDITAAGRAFAVKANFFTLLTEDEKMLYRGVNMTNAMGDEEEDGIRLAASTGAAPSPPKHSFIRGGRAKRSESLDWREYGVVTAVKNQGSCGSCWSFGAIAAVEGAYKLVTNTSKTFSEQQVVNCNADYGCSGGWWPTVWDDIKNNKYVALYADQPYQGSKGSTCSRTTTNGITGAQVTGYKIIREYNAEDKVIQNIQSYGPLAVCIYVDDAVYYYSSGTLDSCIGDNCNHLVTMVGYDANSYLIKNSWGTDWGIDGYMNIQRGCADKAGYSYWASFAYLISDSSSSDDDSSDSEDSSEGSTDSNEETGDDAALKVIVSQTSVKKGTKYTLGDDSSSLQVGDIISIAGTDVSSSNAKWVVNIMQGANYALHYEQQRSKSRYRLNSREGGSWGSKVQGTFPASVTEDGPFVLNITITEAGYDVKINDDTLDSFAHKIDMTTVDKVEVRGKSGKFTSITQYRLDTTSAESSADDASSEEPSEDAGESASCYDLQSYCGYWKDEGYCEEGNEYRNWMHANCPNSCGSC